MLPGPTQVLTCPFCGGKKGIISLRSGNTFGSELWSDNRRVSPMLPEISLIQKCPQCSRYYLLSGQKKEFDENFPSAGRGLLSFSEMKEAWEQLRSEGFEDKKIETAVRFMLLYSYNDWYFVSDRSNKESSRFRVYCSGDLNGRRAREKRVIDPSDFDLFRENVLEIISRSGDDLFKAEMYREIGEFSKAQELLNGYTTENKFAQKILEEIGARIRDRDSKVFRIE